MKSFGEVKGLEKGGGFLEKKIMKGPDRKR